MKKKRNHTHKPRKHSEKLGTSRINSGKPAQTRPKLIENSPKTRQNSSILEKTRENSRKLAKTRKNSRKLAKTRANSRKLAKTLKNSSKPAKTRSNSLKLGKTQLNSTQFAVSKHYRHRSGRRRICTTSSSASPLRLGFHRINDPCSGYIPNSSRIQFQTATCKPISQHHLYRIHEPSKVCRIPCVGNSNKLDFGTVLILSKSGD